MERRAFIKGSAILGMSIATQQLVSQSGMFSFVTNRKVYRILNASSVKVGTLPVMRAFAGDKLDYVSPFVLFDEFGPVKINPGSDPLRVDAHPHAGVTPTTFLLEGSGHHKDSLNFDFQIDKGDFMMFSSGRGAIHMEETGASTLKTGGFLHGFQIWLNTPAKYKFIEPTTSVHRIKQMDIIETSQYWAKVVLGRLHDAKSSIETLSPAFYYHIKLRENGRIDIPVHELDNAFLYNISGEVELEGAEKLVKNQIVLFERGASNINLYTACGAEFLVLGGRPLEEPVYSYGPFVMNTESQIKQCISNYQSGKMGNLDIVNK